MVQVTIIYGSIYARLVGKSSEQVRLAEPTVNGLLENLARTHESMFVEALVDTNLALMPGVSLLVNGTPAARDTILGEGDEVALLLSFEGG